MSACRLNIEIIEAPCFSVVGTCTTGDAVCHIGLLAQTTSIRNDALVCVHHMANHTDRLQLPGEMRANAIGWIIEELAEEELTCVAQWLEELEKNRSEIFYSPCPAVVYEADPASGKRIRRKFSCAGFIQSCFEEALEISLVVPEEKLPAVDANVLGQVWDARWVAIAQRRNMLPGPGPWKILLPSYLFHALCQNRAALPHTPAIANPAFA